MPTAAIVGCAGRQLSSMERQFFADADPWGFIVFARNIDEPVQVLALVEELRATVGRTAPVLIDQEGGRVARLQPPHWREWDAPAVLAKRQDLTPADRYRAFELRYGLIANEMAELGINVNCAPVLDIPSAGAHDVIGDRALGWDAETVTWHGRAACAGMVSGGVLPVLKHIPGHGRAAVDSHIELPVIAAAADELAATDFVPFRELDDYPLAMTAHVTYTDLDNGAPATFSPTVIAKTIRETIGFEGALLSDDICMGALSGPMRQRAERSIAAGCDVVLHCSGDLAEMQDMMASVPTLLGQALTRTEAVDGYPFASRRASSLSPAEMVVEYRQIVGSGTDG